MTVMVHALYFLHLIMVWSVLERRLIKDPIRPSPRKPWFSKVGTWGRDEIYPDVFTVTHLAPEDSDLATTKAIQATVLLAGRGWLLGPLGKTWHQRQICEKNNLWLNGIMAWHSNKWDVTNLSMDLMEYIYIYSQWLANPLGLHILGT